MPRLLPTALLALCLAAGAAGAQHFAPPTPRPAPLPDPAGSGPEMRFRLECEGNNALSCVVVAEGRIVAGTAERFRTLHDAGTFEGNRVLFDSPGGVLGDGLALGRLLRARGFETEVGRWQADGATGRVVPGGSCASACAYAFLGGTLRRVAPGNRLGFHQFALTRAGLRDTDGGTGGAETAQRLASEIVTYLVEMDVDPRIFARGTEAGRREMHYATDDELRSFGLITPEGFGAFFLEPWRAGIVAASRRNGPTRLYDEMTQITAYCRDGTAHLLLSFQGFGAISGEGRLVATSGGQPRDFTLPADRTLPRGDSAAELRLTDVERDALLAAEGFAVVLSRGMASGGPVQGRFALREDDRARIAAAFRFCI